MPQVVVKTVEQALGEVIASYVTQVARLAVENESLKQQLMIYQQKIKELQVGNQAPQTDKVVDIFKS